MYKRKIRTKFSMVYCGIMLVPNPKPGKHNSFIAPLKIFHLMLLELSLEPIKIPQIYMKNKAKYHFKSRNSQLSNSCRSQPLVRSIYK